MLRCFDIFDSVQNSEDCVSYNPTYITLTLKTSDSTHASTVQLIKDKQELDTGTRNGFLMVTFHVFVDNCEVTKISFIDYHQKEK